MLQVAAAAAALVFIPISLFADDLRNCDCARGIMNVEEKLSVLAAVV